MAVHSRTDLDVAAQGVDMAGLDMAVHGVDVAAQQELHMAA